MNNEHSAQFDNLKRRYDQGRITKEMLRKYVQTNRISPEEYEEITGEKY